MQVSFRVMVVGVFLFSGWASAGALALKTNDLALIKRIFTHYNPVTGDAFADSGNRLVMVTRKTSHTLVNGKVVDVVLAQLTSDDQYRVLVLDGETILADSGRITPDHSDTQNVGCSDPSIGNGDDGDSSLMSVESIKLDLAPFKLNDSETALGVRISLNCKYGIVHGYDLNLSKEDLVLYRVQSGKFSRVLTVVSETDDNTLSGEQDAQPQTDTHNYTLRVLPTKTQGFFDWQVEEKAPPKDKQVMHWDGKKYVKQLYLQTYQWAGAKYEKKGPPGGGASPVPSPAH